VVVVSGRVIPIHRGRHRRAIVERSMREALAALVAGLNGGVPLHDAVFEADAALRAAVREACASEVAS
jgi:hypothetical protein